MVTYEKVSMLAAFINLLASVVVFWICLCRLNTKRCKVFLNVRFKYTILLVGSLASGLQPILWNIYPNIGHCILTLAIVIYLYSGKLTIRNRKKESPQ